MIFHKPTFWWPNATGLRTRPLLYARPPRRPVYRRLLLLLLLLSGFFFFFCSKLSERRKRLLPKTRSFPFRACSGYCFCVFPCLPGSFGTMENPRTCTRRMDGNRDRFYTRVSKHVSDTRAKRSMQHHNGVGAGEEALRVCVHGNR